MRVRTVHCRDCLWTHTGRDCAKQLAVHKLIHPYADKHPVNVYQERFRRYRRMRMWRHFHA